MQKQYINRQKFLHTTVTTYNGQKNIMIRPLLASEL